MQAQNLVLPCNEGMPSPYLSRGNNYATCVPLHQTAPYAGQLYNGPVGVQWPHLPCNATFCYLLSPHALQTEAAGKFQAACFEVAPQTWSLGPVHLQRVLVYEDAWFSVVQSSGAPNDVAPAAACFPNCPPGPCVVNVSPPLFTYREAMVNSFCHELGYGPGGFVNPEYVMNYNNHPLEMTVDKPDIVPTNVPYAYDANSLQGLPTDVVPPTSEPSEVRWKWGVQ